MKAAVIINRSGDSAKTEENEKLIKNTFEDLNVECEVYAIEGSEIENTAKKLAEEDIDVLIAAGGDGTVRTIASILAGGKISLGVLPCGTLNHFAKDIGMPLDIKEAVKAITLGKIKMLDIAEVNNVKFINNSSIGLYPYMVKERETEQEQGLRNKWAAMFLAMVRTFKKFPLYNVEIKIKGKLVKLSTSIVFVGNNKYIVEFYNVGSRNRLDEGVLSLYLTCCKSRLCLIRLSFLSFINRMRQDRDFEMSSATEVTINSRRKYIDVSLDGEVTRMTPPLLYKINPKSLPVIVPVTE